LITRRSIYLRASLQLPHSSLGSKITSQNMGFVRTTTGTIMLLNVFKFTCHHAAVSCTASEQTERYSQKSQASRTSSATVAFLITRPSPYSVAPVRHVPPIFSKQESRRNL